MIEQLYDDLIMEHIRNARNFRAPRHATGKANGLNPLCGDDLTVYVRIERGVLRDAAFRCSCCGVSMASASIMTESVIGMRAVEAKALMEAFITAVKAGVAPESASPGQRALVETVLKYPVRMRCAELPWATLMAVLESRPKGGGMKDEG